MIARAHLKWVEESRGHIFSAARSGASISRPLHCYLWSEIKYECGCFFEGFELYAIHLQLSTLSGHSLLNLTLMYSPTWLRMHIELN
jgi:hypothetical protein